MRYIRLYSLAVLALLAVLITRASSISNGGGGGGGGGTGNAAANVTTTFSATPTFTCPSATAGTVVNFTLSTALTANITSSTLASCTNGSLLNFIFTQDATGGRTVAMPASFDAAVVHPTANIASKCSYFLDASGNGKLTGGGCVSTATSGFGLEAAAPGTPPVNRCFTWFDSTNHIASYKCNNSATISNSVVPVTRPANQFVTSLGANGVLGTSAVVAGDITTALNNSTSIRNLFVPVDPSGGSGTVPVNITKSFQAMPTIAVPANSCSASATTTSVTGADAGSLVVATFAQDPTLVTGYAGGTPNGGITINVWPTTNTINWKLCNQTSSSITPGAMNVNFMVLF